MPARPPHVRLCGDLETACTDVLLYLAAYSELNGSGPGHSTVGLRGLKLNPALLGYGPVGRQLEQLDAGAASENVG